MALEERPGGVHVSVTRITGAAEQSKVTVSDLPGAAIPQPECGPGLSRCPLTCRAAEPNRHICFFPVSNGTQNYLTVVDFEESFDPPNFTGRETKLVPPNTASCVPLLVFEQAGLVENLVPCLNITQHHFLYFETLNPALSVLEGNTYVSQRYIPVDGHVSHLLYGDGINNARTCSPPHNVFFKVNREMYVFRIFDNHAEFYRDEASIEKCPFTEEFDFFEPNLLRVQCSATDVALYDPCSSQDVEERLDLSVNATIFQCAKADLNIHHFEGNLTVELYGASIGRDDIVSTIELPFNDTVTGRCVGDTAPVLFLTRGNGETHFLELSTGKLEFLATNTCGPHSCLNLNVLQRGKGLFVGVFDYSSNTYIVLNLTCRDSTIISRVPYAGPPARLTLVGSGKTSQCLPCNDRGPVTTPTDQPTVSVSPHTQPTASDTPPSEADPEISTGSSGRRLALQSEVIAATGSVGAVLVLAVAILAVVIALVFTM